MQQIRNDTKEDKKRNINERKKTIGIKIKKTKGKENSNKCKNMCLGFH